MAAFIRLPGGVAAVSPDFDFFADWSPPCGTTCCIAGHACLMFGAPSSLICEDEAAEILGLDAGQVDQLFYDSDGYVSECESESLLEFITRAEAVAAIRRMVAEDKLEHGVVAVETGELVYA